MKISEAEAVANVCQSLGSIEWKSSSSHKQPTDSPKHHNFNTISHRIWQDNFPFYIEIQKPRFVYKIHNSKIIFGCIINPDLKLYYSAIK